MSGAQKGIYIAILNQGNLRVELAQVLLELQTQGKYQLKITFPADKPITYNRNRIVKRFLETDYDYLLMIDDDIIPPLKILDLADYQEDIVGALCFAWRKNDVIPLVLKSIKDNENQYNIMAFQGDEGLLECDAVGSGCLMVRRDVLENPYWKKTGGWFRNYYDNEGQKVQGLDLAFCKRARALGYKVFCHLDYPCSHWVGFDLKSIYLALIDSQDQIEELKVANKKIKQKNENIKTECKTDGKIPHSPLEGRKITI